MLHRFRETIAEWLATATFWGIAAHLPTVQSIAALLGGTGTLLLGIASLGRELRASRETRKTDGP